MTTIVYPYLANQNVWQEIVYSIRSVEKHFKGDYEICIVGNMPTGIDVYKVIYIPHKKNVRLPNARYMDAQLKLIEAMNDNRVSNDFVCMYDDIYFNNDTNIDLIRQRSFIANQNVDYKTIEDIGGNGSREWKELTLKSFNALREKNIKPYDFETHFPRWVSKRELAEVVKIFVLEREPCQRWTLYFSYMVDEYGLDVKFYNDGYQFLKAGFYGNKKADYNLAEYKTINHNDLGINSILRKKIQDLFPKKSKFEI